MTIQYRNPLVTVDIIIEIDNKSEHELPNPIVFDHEKILKDYLQFKKGALLKDIFSY